MLVHFIQWLHEPQLTLESAQIPLDLLAHRPHILIFSYLQVEFVILALVTYQS